MQEVHRVLRSSSPREHGMLRVESLPAIPNQAAQSARSWFLSTWSDPLERRRRKHPRRQHRLKLEPRAQPKDIHSQQLHKNELELGKRLQKLQNVFSEEHGVGVATSIFERLSKPRALVVESKQPDEVSRSQAKPRHPLYIPGVPKRLQERWEHMPAVGLAAEKQKVDESTSALKRKKMRARVVAPDVDQVVTPKEPLRRRPDSDGYSCSQRDHIPCQPVHGAPESKNSLNTKISDVQQSGSAADQKQPEVCAETIDDHAGQPSTLEDDTETLQTADEYGNAPDASEPENQNSEVNLELNSQSGRQDHTPSQSERGHAESASAQMQTDQTCTDHQGQTQTFEEYTETFEATDEYADTFEASEFEDESSEVRSEVSRSSSESRDTCVSQGTGTQGGYESNESL